MSSNDKLKYPITMCHKTRLYQVRFTGYRKGVIIKKGDKPLIYPLGHKSNSWRMERFAPLKQKRKLKLTSNEKLKQNKDIQE